MNEAVSVWYFRRSPSALEMVRGRDVELLSVGCGVQETTPPLPLTSWDALLAGCPVHLSFALLVFALSRRQADPGCAHQGLSHLGGDVGVSNRSCHQMIPVGRKEPVLGQATFTSYPRLRSLKKRIVLQG